MISCLRMHAYCDIDNLFIIRIALCIDGSKRFAANAEKLLGKEAIKQRHLRILGYEVVQVKQTSFLLAFYLPTVLY